MRITNKDLEFLVELENYLGARESWSPMVSRLWELNERLLGSKLITKKRVHGSRRKIRKVMPLKAIALNDDVPRVSRGFNLEDIDSVIDTDAAELLEDLVRISNGDFSIDSKKLKSAEQKSSTSSPKYSVRIRLRRKPTKHD